MSRPEIYSELRAGEIRLLTLQPGALGSDIRCGLHTVCLDDTLQYEALSYVWGDPSVLSLIELDSAPFPVTDNLETALRHIRHEDRERTLWIDAVCINQANLAERGSQVSRMGDIFAYAEQVLAWLGDSTEMTNLAIDGIKRLVGDPNLHWTRPRKSKSSFGRAEYIDAEHILTGYVELGERPWWTRVWTVPEALLARKLLFVCGKAIVLAEDLTKFAQLYFAHVDKSSCCRDLNHRKPENWAAVNLYILPALTFRREIVADYADVPAFDETSLDPEQRSRRLAQFAAVERGRDAASDKYFRLMDQVCGYRGRFCTDPRDKIYGLLGMVHDLKRNLLPDYGASCDKVYADFAFRVIQEQQSLDLLSLLVPGQWEYAVPTWAPDWRYRTVINDEPIRAVWDDRLLYDRFNNLNNFDAAAGLPSVVAQHAGLVLSVEGFILDEIEFLSSYHYGYKYGRAASWPNIFIDIWNIDCGDFWPDMETAIEAFLGYPRATGALLRRSKYYLMLQRYLSDRSKKFRKAVRTVRRLVTNERINDWYDSADVFDEALGLRRYAITRKNAVGFVPYSAQPGDKICILFGARVPFVFRESPEKIEFEGTDHPKFVLLGDCYIHGFMHGEAVKKMENGEVTRQKFFVR